MYRFIYIYIYTRMYMYIYIHNMFCFMMFYEFLCVCVCIYIVCTHVHLNFTWNPTAISSHIISNRKIHLWNPPPAHGDFVSFLKTGHQSLWCTSPSQTLLAWQKDSHQGIGGYPQRFLDYSNMASWEIC